MAELGEIIRGFMVAPNHDCQDGCELLPTVIEVKVAELTELPRDGHAVKVEFVSDGLRYDLVPSRLWKLRALSNPYLEISTKEEKVDVGKCPASSFAVLLQGAVYAVQSTMTLMG